MARSKTDHMRKKAETVVMGKEDKEYTVKPKTNGELIELAEKLQEAWKGAADTDLKDTSLVDLIKTKPVEFINEIVEEEFTEEDWLNSYPDDVYNLVVVFKDVNFTFLKQLSAPVQRIMQYLSAQQNQKKPLTSTKK